MSHKILVAVALLAACCFLVVDARASGSGKGKEKGKGKCVDEPSSEPRLTESQKAAIEKIEEYILESDDENPDQEMLNSEIRNLESVISGTPIFDCVDEPSSDSRLSEEQMAEMKRILLEAGSENPEMSDFNPEQETQDPIRSKRRYNKLSENVWKPSAPNKAPELRPVIPSRTPEERRELVQHIDRSMAFLDYIQIVYPQFRLPKPFNWLEDFQMDKEIDKFRVNKRYSH